MEEYPLSDFVVDLDQRTVLHKPSGVWISFYEYQNEKDWKASDSVTLRDSPKFAGDLRALARDAKRAAIAAGMTARRPKQPVASQ